jgi:hypothetical protein
VESENAELTEVGSRIVVSGGQGEWREGAMKRE